MKLRWYRLTNEEPFPDAWYAYLHGAKLAVTPIAYDDGREKAWALFHVRKGHPVKFLSEAKTVEEAKAQGDAFALKPELW